jgi:Leucine-rich repeat (LRR) protein
MPLKNFIEGLILNEDIDFGELCHFKKLKYLGALDNKKNILDLKCFPDLETLACSVTERLKGLETCSNLKSLTISYYKPKDKDLSALPALNALKHLSLIKVDIATLRGIDKFKNLKKLEIFSSPKLESIVLLQVLSGSLEEIDIDQCKKIKDYETLGKLQSLKKIMLTDSGEMKTIAFVKALPHLQFISFWNTNVLDGNLGYCEGINYVGFDNKRHYSHKVEQFKK